MKTSKEVALKACVCGEEDILSCDYFRFDGHNPVEYIKLHGCEECYRENKSWCQEHSAPLSVTNDPGFKGLKVRYRISPEIIGFCVLCIEDDIRSTDATVYEECTRILERKGDSDTQQMLSDRANRLLPFEINWRESLILGCFLTNHVESSFIEQTVLKYTFNEEPKQIYRRAVDSNQHV